MRRYFCIPYALMVAVISTLVSTLQAQPLVKIETVLVGDAGNAPYTNGRYSVPYEYRIGKYEVTISQYAAFLNSAASSDPHGLYTPSMETDSYVAGIVRSGSDGSYTYSVTGPRGIKPAGATSAGNRPIAYISWFDAARFCNWLHNGGTNGASTETGAYTLNGASNGVVLKNPDAKWWIPSENEWFKAAYYKGGSTNAGYWTYPTRSDTPPANNIGGGANQANYLDGTIEYSVTRSIYLDNNQNYLTDVGAYSASPSPYGTFDQAGNVVEWNDSAISGPAGSTRGYHGGYWPSSQAEILAIGGKYGTDPQDQFNITGFRVATAATNTSTNVILTVETTGDLKDIWRKLPISSDMLTPSGDINAGQLTATNRFYRLKIQLIGQ